jgi:ABC-type multidrug transport system fused ATPase/permease subunit
MALVPQDPFLFSVSLRENIAWGGEDDPKQPDEARLQRAIQLACLEGDLHALAQGLDTIVGARGITLSGGQRQRSALARAFYRRFCILLLDDVMAAVDHKTERQLIQNIYSRVGRVEDAAQTTVLISHRLSALQHADRILVLQEGKLIDQGTHAELLSRPGLYQECWLQQQEKQPLETSQPAPLAG